MATGWISFVVPVLANEALAPPLNLRCEAPCLGMNDAGGKRHLERTLQDTGPPPGVSLALRTYGALRTVTVISPLLVGSNMDTLKQTQNKKPSDAEGAEEPSDVLSTTADEAALFGNLFEEPSTTTPSKQKSNTQAPRRKKRKKLLAAKGRNMTSNHSGNFRQKRRHSKQMLTPSAKKALGTSVVAVKPLQMKKQATKTRALPIPSAGYSAVKHSEFHITISQKGGEQLNEEHVQLFFETVGDAILDLSTCSSFIPAFESCKICNGQILITAKNRASKDWLLRHLWKIRPWNGADLVATGPPEGSSSIKYQSAYLWVPTARYSEVEILQILDSQNPELMIPLWKVQGMKPEPWGLVLKVDIDSRCISALKDINLQPFFVLRRVDVQLEVNLKRKIPTDLNSSASSVGPTKVKRTKALLSSSDVQANQSVQLNAPEPAPQKKPSKRKPNKAQRMKRRRMEASQTKPAIPPPKHTTQSSSKRKVDRPRSRMVSSPRYRADSPPRPRVPSFSFRTGSPPRRREMLSYNSNQQASRNPSLLQMRDLVPNTSQMLSSLYRDPVTDTELTSDDRYKMFYSRELDFDRNTSLLRKSDISASRGSSSEIFGSSFQVRHDKELVQTNSLPRTANTLMRASFLEDELISQRVRYSPPMSQERDPYLSFSSRAVPRIESSSSRFQVNDRPSLLAFQNQSEFRHPSDEFYAKSTILTNRPKKQYYYTK
ncbi:unnamed protein product [Acanthoscelides obtectus]|uniref:DUF4780 domain-containing protein n=1 Tax=Acanthoscelides obtectus TaxID=200917 RepID=A0A9P0KWP6_ACAOB|nr:unnamed protein product [Acanthoscelides obtectus]CAK1673135.1 hypothetical protein AOBTE_LOCUS29248 [Acanthoscelides obtectus]